MKIPNWGAFKGTYRGEGIYWGGSYNTEGEGEFRTLAECRAYIDQKHDARMKRERDEAHKLASEGKALLVEKHKDTMRVHLPTGLIELPIRAYRQNVFDWETKYGLPVVVVDIDFESEVAR